MKLSMQIAPCSADKESRARKTSVSRVYKKHFFKEAQMWTMATFCGERGHLHAARGTFSPHIAHECMPFYNSVTRQSK